MALWDKVRHELDRAAHSAQTALDEGRVRLEAFRARQRADMAAEVLGYAVFRARSAGEELEPERYATLASDIAAHEAEASRMEAQLEELVSGRRARGAGDQS